MRCTRLRKMVGRLAVLATATAISGCTSMNGYVSNASGQGYYEQGNYAAAAAEFEQAMMAEPSNPDYFANLAKARSRMGDASGAEQLYRQALLIEPSHQPSYHGMAEVLLTQGRGQEAASLVQTWAATQPYVAESHIELAWVQSQLGQPDAAAQSLQHALQVNPGHSTALAHLGQYYQDNGRPDQAVALYQQSLQSDWNQPGVHSRLASAAQMSGGTQPMSATAMARGVHPYGIPRQQTVFGSPSQGAQLAQMQMQSQPWQMAQGMPNGPGSYGMSSSPMISESLSTPQMSVNYPTHPEMQLQQSTQMASAPSMVPPGLDLSPPNLPGGWQVVPGSLKVLDSGSTSAGNAMAPATSRSALVPVPSPDPGFSQSAQNSKLQSISYSEPVSSAPELDAF